MNFLNLKKRETSSKANTSIRLSRLVLLIGLLVAVIPFRVSEAQRLYVPVKITDVAARTSDGGTVVTISADGNLSKAQTWHDDEGYHVVLPDTVSDYSLRLARGVKLRRLGSSLEILLQTKSGSRVSMQSAPNQMSLAVDGKLIARPTESTFQPDHSSPEERRVFENQQDSRIQQEAPAVKFSSPTDDLTTQTRPAEITSAVTTPGALTQPQAAQPAVSNQIVPQGDGSVAPPAPASEISVQTDEDGFLASVFSGTSVLIVLALGLFGLMVSRKIRSKQTIVEETRESSANSAEWDAVDSFESNQVQPGQSTSLVKVTDASPNSSPRSPVVRMPVAGPVSLYGAYRIDQEVGKLLLGQPHRIDVLASRAVDDRRAIETSLIKGVNSTELDESARRRAREALEEYGFVARQCASLLLAPDAFDRSSAARALGEIRSEAALPFLLESLYDSESIVRNQAVVSIGELKLPSAIGALLDIARTHPDVPSALLSRTLSACSVEGLDFFDAVVSEPALLTGVEVGKVVEEITQLEPAVAVESLPETDDDERLNQALSALESNDAGERTEALKTLVQFRVKSSVEAIARVARHDAEPTIRSVAISGLGSIDHESVFSSVLIGMADESREVRAAAARSLTRLSFDRADAYVRVIESGDEETIRSVAKACTQAGIVSQNLDRLSNCDHRQAYETFSLICLLSKAQMNQPVLDAIADHPRIDVRLKAVHLLASTGQPEVFDQLRELALKDGVNEVVKTALLEGMYKLDQERLQQDEGVERAFEFNNEATGAQSWSSEVAESSTVDALIFDHLDDVREAAFAFSPPEEVREGAFVINKAPDASSDSAVESVHSEFESHSLAIEEILNNHAYQEPEPDDQEHET